MIFVENSPQRADELIGIKLETDKLESLIIAEFHIRWPNLVIYI